MKRILKNTANIPVNTTYNGKKYSIKPKGSLTLDHNGKDEQATDYLLQTFGFLKDITPNKVYPVNTEGTSKVRLVRDNGTTKTIEVPKVKAVKARGSKHYDNS